MRDIDIVHKEINAGIHIDLDTYARVRNDMTFFFLRTRTRLRMDARGKKAFFFYNFF